MHEVLSNLTIHAAGSFCMYLHTAGDSKNAEATLSEELAMNRIAKKALLLVACVLVTGPSRARQCSHAWNDLTTALHARLATAPEKIVVAKASRVDFVYGYGQRVKVIQQYYGRPIKDTSITPSRFRTQVAGPEAGSCG